VVSFCPQKGVPKHNFSISRFGVSHGCRCATVANAKTADVSTIQFNSFDKPLVSNSLKVVNLSATGIQSCSNTTDLLEQALANLDNVSIPPDASEQITANAARYRQLLGGADPMLLWMVEDEELLAKIENGVHAVSQLLSSEHALVSIACASRFNEADSESQLVQWINLLQQKIVDGSHDTLDFLHWWNCL